ncbi:hypothetical protein [Sedimentitalea arenosa]|jgi:hypothetical protein|nr:hypothetical protein [Arenibacterium arenosum]
MLSFVLTVVRLLKAMVRSWTDPTSRATLTVAFLLLPSRFV